MTRAEPRPLDGPLTRVARVSAAFLGSNLARAAIGFGLSYALARGLGAERFGAWILCTAWASTLTVVVDLGFGVLLTRDGARESAETGRLLIGALMLRLGLAVPLAWLLYESAGSISSDAQTIAGLHAAAVLGTAGAAYGCFGALFRSQPRWLPAVLGVETGWLAIQLAAAWWMVRRGGDGAGTAGWAGSGGAGWVGWAGPDIVSLMTLAILVQVAQMLTAALCWRTVFGDRGRVHWPAPGALTALARRALPFAASGIVANLQTRVAPLMLGYLSTPAELGFFAAASRFASVARLAPQALFAGALPVLSHEHARDRASAERLFHKLDSLLLGVSAVIAAGCALFGAPVLRLVYGPSFAPAAPALLWIGAGLVPLLSNSSRKVFLFAAGGEAGVVRWSAAGLIGQVCLGFVLIPTFGSVGAAVAVALGEGAIWWPLRRAARTTTAADRAEPAEILVT